MTAQLVYCLEKEKSKELSCITYTHNYQNRHANAKLP
jgi:hypothetical protein